jgi:hypothetical protein
MFSRQMTLQKQLEIKTEKALQLKTEGFLIYATKLNATYFPFVAFS